MNSKNLAIFMILSLINITKTAKNETTPQKQPLAKSVEQKKTMPTEKTPTSEKETDKSKKTKAPNKVIPKRELSPEEKKRFEARIKEEQDYIKKEKAKDYKKSAAKEAGIIKCYTQYEKKKEDLYKIHSAKTSEQKKNDVKDYYRELRAALNEEYKCFEQYPLKMNDRDQIIDDYKTKQEQKTEASKK